MHDYIWCCSEAAATEQEIRDRVRTNKKEEGCIAEEANRKPFRMRGRCVGLLSSDLRWPTKKGLTKEDEG